MVQSIIEYAIREMKFLGDYGFSKPAVKSGRWITTVSALSSGIAVGMELDWRDMEVFVLITELVDGRLPGGYYLSEGKVCRIHLESALKRIHAIDDSDTSSQLKKQPGRAGRGEAEMKARISDYASLLKKHVATIKNEKSLLFV